MARLIFSTEPEDQSLTCQKNISSLVKDEIVSFRWSARNVGTSHRDTGTWGLDLELDRPWWKLTVIRGGNLYFKNPMI